MNDSQRATLLGTTAEIERLRTYFGDAQFAWKSSRDPEIPSCLHKDRQTIEEPVLTVRCEKGLAALVANQEGVHQLTARNPKLSQALVSRWDEAFIFWVRFNSAVTNGDALSNKGIELVQSGIVPVGHDPANFRHWIHIEGLPLAFESLDLSFMTESEVGQARIPSQTASQLRTLFGEATFQLISSLDATIPSILKPLGSGPQQGTTVVAIKLGDGLGVVISKPERLEELEQFQPRLRGAMLSQWQGHHLHWVRFHPKDGEKLLSGPGRTGSLDAEAFFVGQGLVPIASASADGELFVVRQGTMLRVNLTAADTQKNASSSPAVAEGGSPRQPDDLPDEMQADDQQSQTTSSALNEALRELQTVFGEDRVLENVDVKDPQVPAGLVVTEEIGSETMDSGLLAVKCGPHAKGHLVAVVIPKIANAETFRVKNPQLYSIATGWGHSIVIWLRLEGSVPRNLNAGSVVWISEGLMPVSTHEATVITFLQPGARIPLARFDEIQWETEVAQAFVADETQQSHGSPFLPVRPREFVLNPDFLAELLLKQLDLVYDGTQESFRRFDVTTCTWASLSRIKILRSVTHRLIQLSHDFPREFPPTEISKALAEKVVWLMEMKGDRDIPTAEQAAELFFSEGLEKCAGHELTQEESYAGLASFCRAMKWPLCSRAFFDRAATDRFGQTSHCLGPNGSLRGRIGWKLKVEISLNTGGQDANPAPKSPEETPIPNAT